ELGGRAKAVRVDVDQRRAADERRVRPRDHEGRALHRTAHSEPFGKPPREGGLPGPERTGQHKQIPRLQLLADAQAELLHRLGRGDLAPSEERRIDAHERLLGSWVCRGTRGPMRVTISELMVPAAAAQSVADGAPDGGSQEGWNWSPPAAPAAQPHTADRVHHRPLD